ncbi:type IV secretory system conjugative DNA transfer family protein [Nocardia sp. NPDC003482]
MENEQLPLPLEPETFVWQRVWFPRPFRETTAFGLIRYWASQDHAPHIILEARASVDGVAYLVGSQLKNAERVSQAIETLVQGSVVTHFLDGRDPVVTARRVQASTSGRTLEPDDAVSSAKAILHAMTAVSRGEQLVIQLALGPRRRPQLPPSIPQQENQTVVSKVLDGIKPAPDADAKQALARKRGQHGFDATLRIGVTASEEVRRRTLLLGLASALGTVNAPGVHLVLRPDAAKRINEPGATWMFWPLIGHARHLAISEAVRLSGWPVSDKEEVFPGQGSLHPRKLRPTPALLSGQRVIANSDAPGIEGMVGYGVDDSMRHTHLLGPSGTGKSTLLLNLIVSDLQAGHGLVVMEPKDLVEDVLHRIPKERWKDVAILDPLDEFPVGINPLDRMRGGTPPEVVADSIFNIFYTLYGDSLGRRSGDILRESLKAIALRADPSLIMLPLIMTDPNFRRPLVRKAVARDPFAAGTFWSWYEELSPEGAMNNIAPLSNKVRPFLDIYLRGILAQQRPRFNVRQVLEEKKILLVPLQPGVIGPDRARLLAAFVLAELWLAIRERAATPEAKRDPVMVYVDEVQEFLNLPVDLDDALATARSLKAGFHLAHQYISQLPPQMARAFKNNARNKVAFQLGADDAKEMATGQSALAPEDFTALPAHHVYMKLVRDNSVQPWASGETLPPPPKTSDPSTIRQLSREQFGRPRAEIEAEFRQLLDGPATGNTAGSPTPRSRGRKRRQA